MFSVEWQGRPPADKDEWIRIIEEVLMGSLGFYSIRFRKEPRGWRFDLDVHEDQGEQAGEIVGNSPEGVRYGLYLALTERGKPLDPNWRQDAGRVHTGLEEG